LVCLRVYAAFARLYMAVRMDKRRHRPIWSSASRRIDADNIGNEKLRFA